MAGPENPQENPNGQGGYKRRPDLAAKRDTLRRLDWSDRTWNKIVKAGFFLHVLRHPGSFRSLPEMREFFREQEMRTGLLTGAIFEQGLFVPTTDETELEFRASRPGTWVGYDFDRAEQFGDRVKQQGKQYKQGRLAVFDLDEVADHAPDDYTPTGLLNMMHPDHVFQFDILPVSELIEKGYVVETTYGDAFERAGLTEKYGGDLEQIGKRKVYAITPKGNGLVFLLRGEGGQRKPSKSRKSSFVDIFVPSPAPTPA